MKNSHYLFITLTLAISNFALSSTIKLNCVYRAEDETVNIYDALLESESPKINAKFENGSYVISRPLFVDALGTCVERADAKSVTDRRQYFVIGIAGYELGKFWNGRYYSVFHGDHIRVEGDENINSDSPNYISGKARAAAADLLFPKSLVLNTINENKDTFANAFIEYQKNATKRVNSVDDLITDRTRQDLPRFDVFFDAFEGQNFVAKYEHFISAEGACQVNQAGQIRRNCSQEELQSSLPSEVLMSAIKDRDLNDKQAAALIEKLRFAFDTRFRTQEFDSFALVHARTEIFKPKNGIIQLSTDGVRQHNFVLKGDRLILHTEVEYMFNHLDSVRLGTLVTVRAQRVMVFDLKDLKNTKEHMFLVRKF